MTYHLSAPPLVADLQAHAQAICVQAFKVSHRTVADWPIEILLVNGRRQPETAEVWAYAQAVLGERLSPSVLGERLSPSVLDRMSDSLRAEVDDRLPAAREIKAARDAKLKKGQGKYLRKGEVAAAAAW